MPDGGRTDQLDVWRGHLLDLDAYLHRIGIDDGAPEPTFETLRALQRAHITSIPFENGEVILGRPTPLDVETLQDKMVRSRRGGYCFEHAILFAAALERLGFGVTGLLSRITMGADKHLPLTHAAIKVHTEDNDRTWVSDVGRGGGPLEPIELADGAVLQDNWNFTLRRAEHAGTEYWTLYASRPEGQLDLHQFTLTPSYPIDYVVGNHYIATHPDSPFTTRIIAQKLDDNTWHFLDGTTLTSTYRGGTKQVREHSPTDIPLLLANTFDIALTAEDAAMLVRLCLSIRGGELDGGGKQDSAEVGAGVLVVTGGDATPLFEAVEAALDGVALRVGVRVECWWSAAGGSFTLAALYLVSTLRDGVWDPAAA